jgi:hypothetical protein
MGMMTDDMKRLRGEVETLRKERGALLKDLALETKRRRDGVATMQAHFHKIHGNMAKNTQAERRAYISGQKKAVAHLRKVFATDLAGASRAWFGSSV